MNVFLLALNRTENNELKMEQIFCSNLGKSMEYILPLVLLGSIPQLKIWVLVEEAKSNASS